MHELQAAVGKAIKHFWRTRSNQAGKQGSKTGRKDYGERGSVTGAAQLDGFIALIKTLLLESGLPESSIFCKSKIDLPGYFRPEKCWDLLVVIDGQLLAVIECKSQVGPSFGNNYNNRTEKSLGSATDLWAAYREGAYAPSQRPWLGFLMLLEESPGSMRPVKATESHFKVFPEFQGASYAKRYEVLLLKLLRERLYDGTCFLLSTSAGGIKGKFSEPSEELTFQKFASHNWWGSLRSAHPTRLVVLATIDTSLIHHRQTKHRIHQHRTPDAAAGIRNRSQGTVPIFVAPATLRCESA